jgi:adenine-specific DNA methylase
MDKQQMFIYPSTRYSGSKRRMLDWIWSHLRDLKFNSVVDVFGGTASVSLLFKKHGKKVHYNDLLKFNMIIGKAVVENSHTVVTDRDVEEILTFNDKDYPDFIEKHFKGIFYLDEENRWLDKMVYNTNKLSDPYKKAIVLSALFQACLAKRPFNLFHRANLYLRTNNVTRSFGNKTTWEHPFEYLLKKYIHEYNRAVFDNGKENKVIGGYDALLCPNGVDLAYFDPPYFSTSGTNYLAFYHFLEGIADYYNWENKKPIYGKINRIKDSDEITAWTRKSRIYNSFEQLFERFQDNTIVLSYQSNGIPTEEEIYQLLKLYKRNVQVYSIPKKYVLSNETKRELLFIAT